MTTTTTDYALPLFVETAHQTPAVEAGALRCQECAGSGAERVGEDEWGDCSICNGTGVEACCHCDADATTLVSRKARCVSCLGYDFLKARAGDVAFASLVVARAARMVRQ